LKPLILLGLLTISAQVVTTSCQAGEILQYDCEQRLGFKTMRLTVDPNRPAVTTTVKGFLVITVKSTFHEGPSRPDDGIAFEARIEIKGETVKIYLLGILSSSFHGKSKTFYGRDIYDCK
jgi:hypothetical protein